MNTFKERVTDAKNGASFGVTEAYNTISTQTGTAAYGQTIKIPNRCKYLDLACLKIGNQFLNLEKSFKVPVGGGIVRFMGFGSVDWLEVDIIGYPKEENDRVKERMDLIMKKACKTLGVTYVRPKAESTIDSGRNVEELIRRSVEHLELSEKFGPGYAKLKRFQPKYNRFERTLRIFKVELQQIFS